MSVTQQRPASPSHRATPLAGIDPFWAPDRVRAARRRLPAKAVLPYVAHGLRPRPRLRASSPLVRQLPLAALFAVGWVLTFVVPSSAVTMPVLFSAGLAIAGFSTLLALLTERQVMTPVWVNLIPAADILALVLLRPATGGAASVFGAMIILPVMWLAVNAGWRYIAYACAGVLLTSLSPILISVQPLVPRELFRTLFTVIVYALAATVVNFVAMQARRHYSAVSERQAAHAEDLDTGAAAQRALLPLNSDPLTGYQVAGVCLPATAVGGDFYDWYRIEGGLGFTLADVMGKGVGAGIFAATARAVVRSARDDDDPVVAVNRADRTLSSELTDAHSFATLFHARLDADTGLLRYVDAGHGLALIVRRDGSRMRITTEWLPLGLAVGPGYESKPLTLGHGDTLIVISDGVLDLYDGEFDAIDQVARIGAAARSAQDIVDAIEKRALQLFPSDDVTVLAIRRD
jgi:sigma-B regulation protein RsbU (phosphoserine phosphatase)